MRFDDAKGGESWVGKSHVRHMTEAELLQDEVERAAVASLEPLLLRIMAEEKEEDEEAEASGAAAASSSPPPLPPPASPAAAAATRLE